MGGRGIATPLKADQAQKQLVPSRANGYEEARGSPRLTGIVGEAARADSVACVDRQGAGQLVGKAKIKKNNIGIVTNILWEGEQGGGAHAQ